MLTPYHAAPCQISHNQDNDFRDAGQASSVSHSRQLLAKLTEYTGGGCVEHQTHQSGSNCSAQSASLSIPVESVELLEFIEFVEFTGLVEFAEIAALRSQ
jgi:hypothetical protein